MTIAEINDFCKNSFVAHLGIEFTQYGEDFVEARMPIEAFKLQPMGLLHGGVSLAFAETVASGGSFILIDRSKYIVLGLQVTGNHISTVNTGNLFAKGELIHKGKLTHVWDVKITSECGELVTAVRVTNVIIQKP